MILEATLPAGPTLRAVIDVDPAVTTELASSPLSAIAATDPIATMFARTFAGRFLPNQPVYFLYGSGANQAAKFQFSFDYRIATLPWNVSGQPLASTLRIGYTQRSLWDITGRSSPFYDTSYMPELVLSAEAPLPKDKSHRLTWLGMRSGFLHESNGREGDLSRSLNTYYIRPGFMLGKLESWFLVVLPEVQVYLGGVGDNPRIKEYRGYGRLRFYVGRNEGLSLMVSSWAGKSFDHGTYQLDLAIPIHARLLNLESFFQVQYFNGYGESLRAFDRRSDAVRAGIGLVR